jgi:hypothetical protein
MQFIESRLKAAIEKAREGDAGDFARRHGHGAQRIPRTAGAVLEAERVRDMSEGARYTPMTLRPLPEDGATSFRSLQTQQHGRRPLNS